MKQNNATFSAKALAYKTLERNTSETFAAKLWINNATFTPKKSPQKLRPEKPYFGLEIEQLKTHAANDWDEVKGNQAMLKAWNKDALCMLNQLRIGQSCKLHFLRGATRNSRPILRENMKQNNATFSAKALAYKTLKRNTSETFSAKLWINIETFTSKKTPQKLRPEKRYFDLEIEQLKS